MSGPGSGHPAPCGGITDPPVWSLSRLPASQCESTLRLCMIYAVVALKLNSVILLLLWFNRQKPEGGRNASCRTHFLLRLMQYYSFQKNCMDLLTTACVALCLLLPAKRLTLTSCDPMLRSIFFVFRIEAKQGGAARSSQRLEQTPGWWCCGH